MQINLSRALRLKKRFIERVQGVEKKIRSGNSVLEGNELADTTALLNLRDKYVSQLVDLKLKIQKATLPIMPQILLLAETKAEIVFLNSVSTVKGIVEGYSEKVMTYSVSMSQDQIEERVISLQNKIDDYQTQIDKFNNETKIEVEE